MNDEIGIYREEAMLILVTLADIRETVNTILAYMEGDDGEEAEEDPS